MIWKVWRVHRSVFEIHCHWIASWKKKYTYSCYNDHFVTSLTRFHLAIKCIPILLSASPLQQAFEIWLCLIWKWKEKNHSLELLKCPAFNYLLWESLRSQKQRWQKGIFNWWWAEVDAINNSKIKWTFVCLLLACDFFSTLFLSFLFKDNSKLVIRYICVCVCMIDARIWLQAV